tara:strand:- start:171 stop:464 length:294 start_codon:yes stop_codon:yes gene_type:complete
MFKLKNFVQGIFGGVALSTLAIMPIANASSITLLDTTMSGHEWKVKLKDGSTLRLNKDGDVKCSYSLVSYQSYLSCATGYMGSDMYETIRDAIADKI